MGLGSTKLFSGTFARSMDAKKRVSVPSNWLLGEEGETFHVIPHPTEGYLVVMRPEDFVLWEEKINQNPKYTAAEKRKAIRQLYGQALETMPDKQGRILLSEKLCADAGLQSEVIFVGGHSRFEIWSKDRHAAVSSDETSVYQKIAEGIGL